MIRIDAKSMDIFVNPISCQDESSLDELIEGTEQLLGALKQGLPECSGVALGVDRLLMLMLGSSHIKEVI